jgi:hypothetical protein
MIFAGLIYFSGMFVTASFPFKASACILFSNRQGRDISLQMPETSAPTGRNAHL